MKAECKTVHLTDLEYLDLKEELARLRNRVKLVPELVGMLKSALLALPDCGCDNVVGGMCEGHQLVDRARAVLAEGK